MENIVKNEALNSSLKSFAQTMVAKGLRDKSSVYMDMLYEPEYSLGRALLLYDKNNPDFYKTKNDKLPSFSEIIKWRDVEITKDKKLMESWHASRKDYDDYLDKLAVNCDQRLVLDQFYKDRDERKKSKEEYLNRK